MMWDKVAGQVNKSRPTRGAWIETRKNGQRYCKAWVAPHAGRVD